MLEIIIDQREPLELKQHCLFNLYTTHLRNLELGDIILKTPTLELIIERKTISDLASSIRDGRLREQKIRLIKNYPRKNIIYIIEGDITKNNSSMKFNKINKYTIYSSIINMLVRDNINLFMSSDIQNTVEFIEMLIKKIQKKTLKIIKSTEIHKINEQNNHDETIYKKTVIENISRTIAINKSMNITPEIIYVSQLGCIPGISYTTATAIVNIYPTMIVLIQTLSTVPEKERIHILQNIKNANSRRIGIKVAKNINKYLFNK
jgi:crossover junction endonuclease MUS81